MISLLTGLIGTKWRPSAAGRTALDPAQTFCVSCTVFTEALTGSDRWRDAGLWVSVGMFEAYGRLRSGVSACCVLEMVGLLDPLCFLSEVLIAHFMQIRSDSSRRIPRT